MPRFFFDLILGSTMVRRDHAGTELTDVDAARRTAFARLSEAAGAASDDLVAVEVRDSRGALLARLSIIARPPVPRANAPGARDADPADLPLYGIVKADGLHWTVVDLQTGSAARYDLKDLVRLSREDAEEFADRLNFRAQGRAMLLDGGNTG